MERRELFRIVTASAIAAPAGAQTHTHPATQKTAAKRFFTAPQLEVLDRLSEIIIPSDDQSPGAHEAGVAAFLDMRAAVDRNLRQAWTQGIDIVNRAARDRFGIAFLECSRQQQEQLVEQMAAHEGSPQNDLERFFELLKPAVVDGYRFSEIGVKQFMGWAGNNLDTKGWTGACRHPEHDPLRKA